VDQQIQNLFLLPMVIASLQAGFYAKVPLVDEFACLYSTDISHDKAAHAIKSLQDSIK